MEPYKLFLDDERVPEHVTWCKIHFDDAPWVIVRSLAEFCKTIKERGLPYHVSFDHDLADGHYLKSIKGVGEFDENTGYDAAVWLTKYCAERGLSLPRYTIHSMSPVGRQRIAAALHGENYERLRNQFLSPGAGDARQNSIQSEDQGND